MNFIKSIFNLSKQDALLLSENFTESVKAIIKKIEDSNKEFDDDEYYELICQNTLNTIEANEIYIFLPIAFTQLLVPINWPNEYIERRKDGKEINKKFDKTASFKLILDVAKEYFKQNPSKDVILNIASRSAEFNAVNNFLLEGGKVEEITATKTMILR